jgi:flagellar biosynthesis/type III secretory pathway protein FliH
MNIKEAALAQAMDAVVGEDARMEIENLSEHFAKAMTAAYTEGFEYGFEVGRALEEARAAEANNEGYDNGYADGYMDGHAEGYDDAAVIFEGGEQPDVAWEQDDTMDLPPMQEQRDATRPTNPFAWS